MLIDALEPRRLLTTRVHVVGPRYLGIKVRMTVVLKPDAVATRVQSQAVAAVRDFLHPLRGGPGRDGWPFGRNVYASELYELLDTLQGVDYVTPSSGAGQPLPELQTVPEDPARLRFNAQGDIEAVEVRPDELLSAQVEERDIAPLPAVST